MKTLKRFWQQHVAELHNMTWPSQDKALHSTGVVLVIMLLIGIFMGVVDYILKEAVFFFLG